jgi:hypothetical protein
MKGILVLILLSSNLFAGYISDLERNPKVIVVYGEKAPEAEIRIAKEIYSVLKLDKTGDVYDHIVTESYVIKHQFYYANFNLIIVGTPKSNRLCRFNGEVQYALPTNNLAPERILPQFNKTGKGLFSSKYGYYPNSKGIGYIRRILNPFTLQAFNLGGSSYKASPYVAIFISGTDSDGLLSAYSQMLDNQMLEGISVPEENLAKTRARFHLGRENVSNNIPDEINKKWSLTVNKTTLSYKGWIQGSLADYAGIQNMTGLSATQIFHLKFQGEKPSLMTFDDQANSLLLVKFKSPEESFKALKGIDLSYKLNLGMNEEKNIYLCSNGTSEFTIIRKNNFLIIENLNSKWKETFIKEAGTLIKN